MKIYTVVVCMVMLTAVCAFCIRLPRYGGYRRRFYASRIKPTIVAPQIPTAAPDVSLKVQMLAAAKKAIQGAAVMAAGAAAAGGIVTAMEGGGSELEIVGPQIAMSASKFPTTATSTFASTTPDHATSTKTPTSTKADHHVHAMTNVVGMTKEETTHHQVIIFVTVGGGGIVVLGTTIVAALKRLRKGKRATPSDNGDEV
ncbi:hypothetical protein BV898_11479 [Hypsibius exemplaris]|uniref:Uncharacterized protein n=1 Tax=Hypsibius exemplaris TaxID=2072580 RepID=A0A1W0WGN4_HYPEX|nr:hypothetical protein BV898_11479 [Hypsibius exemplaris]